MTESIADRQPRGAESNDGAADGRRGEFDRLREDPRPLRGYAVMMSAYGAGLAGYLWSRSRADAPLPRTEALDIALTGIATHRMSRVLAKEDIAAPIRAPLTDLEGRGGLGETAERPREDVGTLRRAAGKLISCPYCLDQWIATAFAVGYVERPRETRFVAGLMSSAAIANFLQGAYRRVVAR